MCKNEYKQISGRTKKEMIFCHRKGNDGILGQLCVSQRYCPDKGKYITNNQKRDCKYYEES